MPALVWRHCGTAASSKVLMEPCVVTDAGLWAMAGSELLHTRKGNRLPLRLTPHLGQIPYFIIEHYNVAIFFI